MSIDHDGFTFLQADPQSRSRWLLDDKKASGKVFVIAKKMDGSLPKIAESNIIPIVIPPLRNRRADIPPLVDFFIAKHIAGSHRPIRGLTAGARNLIMSYSWPGNVRQLESAIERAILLCEGNEIEVEDLPVEIRQEGTSAAAFNFKLPPEGISFDEVERSLITQAMEQTNWNITRAAKLLGLSFRTLQYRLEKFGIKKASKE